MLKNGADINNTVTSSTMAMQNLPHLALGSPELEG